MQQVDQFGDTAEDPHVVRPASSGNLSDRPPVPTKAPANSRIGQPELIRPCRNQLEGELVDVQKNSC